MSIVNAGQVIKNARLKAKLTQQDLADGICSTVALSKIENGKLGVSPTTFSLLMERCGSPCEAFPAFKNMDDYNCYRLLKEINNSLRHHQLDDAYKKISEVIEMNFADNKFYRQPTMFYYCWLQYCSQTCELGILKEIIVDSLRITKPNINLFDIRNESFSIIEYKCILLYINILLDTKDFETANILLSELNIFIRDKSLEQYNQPTAELTYIHAITYSRYLFHTNDFSEALVWVNKAQELYYSEYMGAFLAYELFILKELITLNHENKTTFSEKLIYYIAAAKFKGCHFINGVIDYLKSNYESTEFLDDYYIDSFTYSTIDFPNLELSDGLFNIYDKDAVSIGRLINHIRKQQGITLQKLCSGICSTSMLSKIENNTLSPTIYVAEALLGRLGIPEDYFTFYGNNEEAEYQRLKKDVMVSSHFGGGNLVESVIKFVNFAEYTGNKLIIQEAISYKYHLYNDKNEFFDILIEGIRITYPDFNLDNINNYILSWTEYTIINGLIKCIYSTQDTFHTASIFHKILINADKPPIANKHFSRPHQISICFYLVFLDVKKMYNETIIFVESINKQIYFFEPYFLNFVIYYYSLAKANVKQLDSIELLAQASIGNSLISNDVSIIENFKKDIYNLTSIKI